MSYIPSNRQLEKVVKRLMKMGLVDERIGENGDIFYDLTEKGKKMGVALSDEYLRK